jgi:beta-lactamase class A
MSTFKIIAVSAVLKKSMTDTKLMEQRVFFTEDEIEKSGYTLVTRKHLSEGMTITELCSAAIEYSDNTAINILIKILGGPDAVTVFRPVHWGRGF